MMPSVSLFAVQWKTVGVIALCVFTGLVALVLWAGCAWRIWLHLRKKQQAVYPLRLISRSNCPAQYQMQIELGTLGKEVQAFWELQGKRLPGGNRKQYSYVQEALPPRQAIHSSSKPSKRPAALKNEKKKAGQTVQKVSMIANLAASISGALAGLLPGAAKAPFRKFNDAIRGQQQKVSAAKAEVNHLQSSTRALSHDVKRLEEATGVKTDGMKASAESEPLVEESGLRLVVTEIPVTETADIQPGESQICHLIIRPKNPLRSLQGSLMVSTQPVEKKEYPLYGALPAITLSADVKIVAKNEQRAAFAGFIVIIGALCAWGAGQLIHWLWLFRA